MKKIYFALVIALVFAISFSFNSQLQYLYGYNFSNDASTTFMGIKSNLVFEKDTDISYFKLSVDLEKLDIKNINNMLPDNSLVSLTNNATLAWLKLPWMLYFVKEAYADFYLGDFTLRVGRFLIQNGSSTLYSPTNLLSAHDFINPFTSSNSLPIDGVKYSNSIGDCDYDLYWSPITYDDIPNSLIYPQKISSNIEFGNSQLLSDSFKLNQKSALASLDAVKAQLKGAGLTDDQIEVLIQNPTLLANYGFTNEQIGQIEAANTLLTLPATYIVTNQNVTVKNKDFLSLKNSNFSVDLDGSLFDYDYKIGFTHDHYHFTIPKTVKISYSENGTGTSEVTLYRPLRDSIFLDFQGVSKLFKSISYHGEVSLIKPEVPYSDVTTSYYVPNTESPTNTILTTQSTKISIFPDYYVKAVTGFEYSKGENFLLGFEAFNGLETEDLKDHISFGVDSYIKAKKDDFSFEGLGLADFIKSNDTYEPGYLVNAKLSYTKFSSFVPSIKVQCSYAKSDLNSIYGFKKLNSVQFMLNSYF